MDNHLSGEGLVYYEHIRKGVKLNAISHQLLRDFTHAIVHEQITSLDALKSAFRQLHNEHTQVFPVTQTPSPTDEGDVVYNDRACRACGEKKCFNFLRQTRAGDEGATLMVYCEGCKREFHAQ